METLKGPNYTMCVLNIELIFTNFFLIRLCADDEHESKDQVTFMGGFKNHGLSIIDFKRSILPLDRHDAPIPFDAPTQVVVAIGDMKVSFGTYKTSLNLETENATIDFSSNGNTCPDRTIRIDVVRRLQNCFNDFLNDSK